jgi:hypothetical protein
MNREYVSDEVVETDLLGWHGVAQTLSRSEFVVSTRQVAGKHKDIGKWSVDPLSFVAPSLGQYAKKIK